MSRGPTAFVLAVLMAGCLSPSSRPRGVGSDHTGGASTGGQTAVAGGSGGGGGGATGSGGTTSTGGTSEAGGRSGSASGGTAGGEGGAGGSGGGVGGGAGDGAGGDGSGGSGGATVTGSTSVRRDAAIDQRQGSGGGSAGSGGGSTTAGGTTGTGGRGGSGGASLGGTGGGGRTGGATGSGGSTAPTPCSFPSGWNPGSATYTTYSLPNAVTACGYNGSNNTIKNIVNGGNFAAIPGNTSSDFNTSNRCGACVQIGSAIITIVDECPNDSNPPCQANASGHLDLSNAAAGAAGVKGDPAVRGQAQWKYVPCPVSGNVIVRLKPGNNNEMFIENEILPIAAVTCAGQTGSRTSYGAWHFGQNIPGASCEVTDIANRKLTVTAGSTQGQDVDTGTQFPKCQ